MIESVGRARTEQPQRYLKQLVSHLGHKLSTRLLEDGSGEIVLHDGMCRLVAGDGVLVLTARAEDEAGLSHVCDVVGRHLERFGTRDELRVSWDRSGQPS
jgi:uncharacterized protein